MENNDPKWEELLDRASGAILGACVGDAVGTIIERIGRQPQQKEVQQCWSMGGGGFLSVAPGQVTDDGEMTVSLFSALLSLGQQSIENAPPQKQLPPTNPNSFPPPPRLPLLSPNRTLGEEVIHEIACYYGRWALSDPFDLGLTIGGSIGSIRTGRKNPPFLEKLLQEEKLIQEKLREGENSSISSSSSSPSPPEHLSLEHLRTFSRALSQSMQNAASHSIEGRTSQSNGSLMRASPIGVWGWRLSDLEIEWLSHQDTSLSHPDKVVAQCVTCYSLAISHLLRAPGDGEGAFRRAEGHARERGWGMVVQWLDIARDPRNFVPFHPMCGWVKIAFIYAFRCTLYGKSYHESLSAVLSGGGDSDTNACIAGGLVGALHGSSDIPPRSLSAVLSCDTSAGRPRPNFLHPNTTLSSLPEFLSTSPSTLLACVGPPSSKTSLLLNHTFPTSFPYTLEDFRRDDEESDDIFYDSPRFVHHISAPARASLELYFRELFEGGESVLDVCSSWVSHLPFGMGLRVVGIGMNKEELEANPILSGYLVWDLNQQDHLPSLSSLQQKITLLPSPSSSSSSSSPSSPSPSPSPFDHITLHVSIDYLTNPLKIIKDAYSLLKKGGRLHISLSNRLFPSKAVYIWKKMSEVERVKFVANLLHLGGFERVEGFVVTRERWVKEGGEDMVWMVCGWKGEGSKV